MQQHIAPEIFKAYDIRGIVGSSLTETAARLIGRALAAKAQSENITRIAVGRDGRLSGTALAAALTEGLTAGGLNVLDIGAAATPMLYFAALQHCGGSGVMITGSHNPPEYNGFKMMLGGHTLAGDDIQALYRTIATQNLPAPAAANGGTQTLSVTDGYRRAVCDSVRLHRPMHIVIDAGNGIAGAFAGDIYRALGCRVEELYCDVDGRFPNHHPDPARPENLTDLIRTVQNSGAELGLAFDGDGDRLGVVTRDGNIIYPDRQLMLFARDVLSRQNGAEIIYDVKSTRLLAPWIRQHGGVPVMAKTGHSFIKAELKQRNAPLAGELSGHVFFKERWFGFDDGLYAGARLLEILSAAADPSAVLNGLPQSHATPEINLPLPKGGNAAELIGKLAASARFDGETERITIDGLRVEFADGFGLVRASNTTPVLVLRFEADTPAALDGIAAQFKTLINAHGLDWH